MNRTDLSTIFSPWIARGALLLSLAPVACSEPKHAASANPPEQPATEVPASGSGKKADAAPSAPPAQARDPRVHEYWGATVTLGEPPPWRAFSPTPEAAAVLGTLRREAIPLPDGLGTVWRSSRNLRAPEANLLGAAFGVLGKKVLTLGKDSGKLYLFDVQSQKLEQQRPLEGFTAGESASFAFLSEVVESDRVLVAREAGMFLTFEDATLTRRLGNAAAGTNVEATKHFGLYGVDDLEVPGGHTIYLQWLTGAVAATIDCKKAARDWSLTEDGKTLGLLHSEEPVVELIDLEQRRLLAEVDAPAKSASMALAPKGEMLAIGGETLVLFSLKTGTVALTDASFEKPITRVRFTPQEDLLLVSSEDGTVRSYALPADLGSIAALPKPQILRHGKGPVLDVQLSTDASQLVTTGTDRELHVWVR